MNSFKLRVMAQVLPFLLIAPALVSAQTPSTRPPSRSEATASLKAGQHQAGKPYTRQQIDQLIAPIALYPDQLLVQVLMAATYPKQVIEAADWLQDPTHAALKGDELAQALTDLQWDPSVKALIAFPQIVAMMAEHLEWTESLGLAFATQQAEVMSRVQALRQLAVKSGRIKNIKHVTVRQQANMIEIASAEPDRVFVPVYNPTVIYGNWPDPKNPPIYIAPPRRSASEAHETTVGTVESGIDVYSYPVVQPLWGWARPDWQRERITIEKDEYTRITRNVQPPPNNVWHREGPIVIVAPSTAPPPAVAVPAGTVAPAQAVAVGELKERATSYSDRVRVENSAVARPAATQQPGTPPDAQRNREASDKGQPPAGGAASAAAGSAPTDTAQPDKMHAQQPSPDKTQSERADKAQAQQPQPDKTQAQHPQPDKTQAQHPQADKAQAEHSQADKTQAQHSQEDKTQAQHKQAEKGQAQHSQAERNQAQQPQAVQPQAQHKQADRAQAPQPQTERTQAQHPQPERTQAQHPQADRPQAQQPQTAAKPAAEKAQPQGHAPAASPSTGGAAQSHAAPAPNHPPAVAEAHGVGSSAPPKPAATPPGHGAEAAPHAPQPHPGAAHEADQPPH